MSIRLYVGNLPKESIERQDLQSMFADVGDSVSTKVIKDRKTGKCRGFAFVTVPNDEVANQFIEKYNGQSFMDSPLKIEKALPRNKSKNSEEGEGETKETEAKSATPAPVKANNSSKRKRNNKSKNRSKSSSIDSQGVQVDPRWADALSTLKERLAAQSK